MYGGIAPAHPRKHVDTRHLRRQQEYDDVYCWRQTWVLLVCCWNSGKMRQLYQSIFLWRVDTCWSEHILSCMWKDLDSFVVVHSWTCDLNDEEVYCRMDQHHRRLLHFFALTSPKTKIKIYIKYVIVIERQ